MSNADADANDIQPADRLYAARAAMSDTRPGARRVGVGELIRATTGDAPRPLTADEQRALFADPRLREDWRRLRAGFTIAELPALAAASSGDVNARRFPGGRLSIHRSRVANQLYVIIRLDDAALRPKSLLLESAAGEVALRPLPAPDARGEILLLLDVTVDDDARLAQLVADPGVSGALLG